MKILRTIPGQVCWCEGEELLAANGRCVVYSNDGGCSAAWKTQIPTAPRTRLKSLSRLGARLFRSGVAQILPLGNRIFLVHHDQNIYRLDLNERSLLDCGQLPGHNALRIEFDGQRIIYGEYFANRDRAAVNIWGSDDLCGHWEKLCTFDDIRHVHAVVYDRYTEGFWITSGDLDGESHLRFASPDFQTIETYHSGKQSYRAIELIVEDNELLYGTDTPLAANAVIAMNRGSRELTRSQEMGGSIFYLRQFGSQLVATTAVEPSEVNNSPNCEIWLRNPNRQWRLLGSFKKDRWSMKYFGFGRIALPSGAGTDEGVWVAPYATETDGKSHLLSYC